MAIPTTTSDRPGALVRRWYDESLRTIDPLVRTWSDAADAALAPWWSMGAAATGSDRVGCGGHRDSECGCRQHDRHRDECGCDPCRICVADADLVLTARPGERRVVPVVLHNSWRRERTVTVQLGEFRGCGCGSEPGVLVTATVAPAGELTVGPCASVEVEVVLVVGVAGEQQPGTDRTVGDGQSLRCATTLYADLTTTGCTRAQRLAVAVLPLECGAYRLPCACGCC